MGEQSGPPTKGNPLGGTTLATGVCQTRLARNFSEVTQVDQYIYSSSRDSSCKTCQAVRQVTPCRLHGANRACRHRGEGDGIRTRARSKGPRLTIRYLNRSVTPSTFPILCCDCVCNDSRQHLPEYCFQIVTASLCVVMPARKPRDPNQKPQVELFREMVRELE